MRGIGAVGFAGLAGLRVIGRYDGHDSKELVEEDSHGIVDSVVREEMPKAIIDLINAAAATGF